MTSKITVKEKIKANIELSKDSVFLRNEFVSFGKYRQVSNAINDIIKDGLLVRVGYGIYSKARKSTLSNKIVPNLSLISIGLEAMRKLGVKADLGKEARALRSGESSQVPMLPIISIGNSKVCRKISFGSKVIIYEKD